MFLFTFSLSLSLTINIGEYSYASIPHQLVRDNDIESSWPFKRYGDRMVLKDPLYSLRACETNPKKKVASITGRDLSAPSLLRSALPPSSSRYPSSPIPLPLSLFPLPLFSNPDHVPSFPVGSSGSLSSSSNVSLFMLLDNHRRFFACS